MELGNNAIWDQLSNYFKRNDKDGILERFLSLYGYDWNNILIPLIEGNTDIINPLKSKDLATNLINSIYYTSNNQLIEDNEKFLLHIGFGLNNPVDIVKDNSFIGPGQNQYPQFYRKLLTFIISLYKFRGTALAIKYWGYILGLDLEVLVLEKYIVRYDSGFNYDDIIKTSELTSRGLLYDLGCNQCVEFMIIAKNSIFGDGSSTELESLCNKSITTITPGIERILENILWLNTPMDAVQNIQKILPQPQVCDDIDICIGQDIDIYEITSDGYDSDLKFDNSVGYDPTDGHNYILIGHMEVGCENLGHAFDNSFDLQEFN